MHTEHDCSRLILLQNVLDKECDSTDKECVSTNMPVVGLYYWRVNKVKGAQAQGRV